MLRVGIVLDSYISRAWVAKVIEDIQSSGFARVELVLLNGDRAADKTGQKSRNRDWKFALFRLYERWDHERYKTGNDAMAPTDVSALLSDVPSISVESGRNHAAGNIPEDQRTPIDNHQLGVIFDFGLSTPRWDIVGAARYGVWSFHHGERYEGSDSAPLFRELVEWKPVSESSLRMFSYSLKCRVIYQSFASTDRVSLYASRNPIYWKTAEFALRGLRALHAGGIEYIQSLPTFNELGTSTGPKNWKPNGLNMILFLRGRLFRWLQARASPKRFGPRTKWFIGIRRRTSAHRFDDPANYLLVPCPKDRFYADPFLFEKDGKTFLFFEDFRFAEGQAVISCCEVGPDGVPNSPVEVLRCAFHLSYPFVFEHEGEVYMIPETRGNRIVELYRATNFPTAWTPEAVLLSDVHVVDATIQKINGKLWMFAGVSNGSYSNSDELCLFFSNAVTGPWTPHVANPVISDVRRARPAGRLFYEQGRLIRPSQDCGKAYGYALVFSEVITLTETKYEERQISRLEPDAVQGCVGTHTYNRTEQFEVVDRTLPAKVTDKSLASG